MIAGQMIDPTRSAVAPETSPMTISVLGATGSVGRSTLSVVDAAPHGTFQIKALTANSNVDALAAAAQKYNAEIAVVADDTKYNDLATALSGTETIAAAGTTGLNEAADRDTDCVMAAIVGAAGLRPVLAAAKRTKRLAIANKEWLVIAGQHFIDELALTETEIIPVDSEHAAVFQVISDRPPDQIERVLLTASGGPFRDWSMERLKSARREDAIKHPNWSMGAKISVDSATMMNKGLELIEAQHLFDLKSDQLDAIIHPQSLLHCLVEYCDTSIVAQLAEPDMKTAIAQSLYWPKRLNKTGARFDFMSLSKLDFEPMDTQRFPAFALAQAAMQRGGAAPAVLNGANEAAVAAFLQGRICFLDIATTVAETINRCESLGLLAPALNIDASLEIDAEARKLAQDVMGLH